MRIPVMVSLPLNKSASIRHLLIACLSGLLMAATPVIVAAAEANGNTPSISQAPPDTANDPLRLWFAKQDKLLDDILVRLARIENLVREIHQRVAQMPAGLTAAASAPMPASAPTAAPAAPTPAPPPNPGVPLPLARSTPAPTGILGFFDTWGSILAGIGLLLLVLMIGQRHRKYPKQPARQAAAPPRHGALIAPKTAGKAAPPAVSGTSGIQRAGASEPSKGQADQALELAEIMLSMGLGHGAAQTLTEQIRNEPKQALLHWLKLLEIYRQNGQQAEFEKSAEELRQHFNVQPEDWQIRPESLRSLEDYPHIAARMCELWGRPAGLVYLQNLLADNRGGARSGFPQSVAEELLLLVSLLKRQGIAPDAGSATVI